MPNLCFFHSVTFSCRLPRTDCLPTCVQSPATVDRPKDTGPKTVGSGRWWSYRLQSTSQSPPTKDTDLVPNPPLYTVDRVIPYGRQVVPTGRQAKDTRSARLKQSTEGHTCSRSDIRPGADSDDGVRIGRYDRA